MDVIYSINLHFCTWGKTQRPLIKVCCTFPSDSKLSISLRCMAEGVTCVWFGIIKFVHIKYESKSTNETERAWNLGLLVQCTLENHFERHFKFCCYLLAKSSVVWLTYQSFQAEKKKASDQPIYVGKSFSKQLHRGQDQHLNTGWVVTFLELFLSLKAWGISHASWGLIQSCNILNQ